MPLDEEQTRRALGRFMSELGLEIRGPNGAIMGLSELLLMNESCSLNEEQKEYLTNIHQNSIKLARAVDYLFRMVRLFYGGVKLFVEEINLNQFIPQTIAAARDHWPTQHYSLDIIEPHLPDKLPSIWMDSQWVQEAIIGVLSEVIGATYRNQEEQKILLAVTHDNTWVKLNISTLEYPNFDEKSPRLFLAQAIAEQHNGQMEVRKTETQLEIILTLPISKNKPVSSE